MDVSTEGRKCHYFFHNNLLQTQAYVIWVKARSAVYKTEFKYDNRLWVTTLTSVLLCSEYNLVNLSLSPRECLVHTLTLQQLPLCLLSLSGHCSLHLPTEPGGTSLLKWMALFAQGRVWLSVSWTWMVIPIRCWLIAGCLVIRPGNSLLQVSGVLSWSHSVGCCGAMYRCQMQQVRLGSVGTGRQQIVGRYQKSSGWVLHVQDTEWRLKWRKCFYPEIFWKHWNHKSKWQADVTSFTEQTPSTRNKHWISAVQTGCRQDTEKHCR